MSEPEMLREGQLKPGQYLVPWCIPSSLALIEVRLQHLEKRREVLLKSLTTDDPNRTTEEPTGNNSERLAELESIQKEVEELQLKQEVLQQHEGTKNYCTPNTVDSGRLQVTPGVQVGALTPVSALARTSAVTRCPSCQQVVSTETRSTVSWVMWTICCLSSMLGCVAGCCLFPFCVDRLRDVHHRCPRCRTHIHTYQPF